MKRIFYMLIISAVISSCGNDKNVYVNDFDQLADWGYNSSMLKSGGAHSGIYYCGLDSNDNYSLTFSKSIKNLGVPNLSSIKISAWVRVRSIPSKAVLVVTIDSAKGPVKYMGIGLKDAVFNSNEWIEIKETFSDIPSGLNPDLKLKIYLNNACKENVDIDDVRFELE
jgi:hypothetical protein